MFDQFISLLSDYMKSIDKAEFNNSYFVLFGYVEKVGERIVTLADFQNKFSRIYAYVEELDIISYLKNRVKESKKLPFKIVLSLEKINNEIIPKIVHVREVPNLEEIKDYYKKFFSLTEKIKSNE